MRKYKMLFLLLVPSIAMADDVLIFQSQTGDYIGQGQTQSLTYSAGTLSITNYGNGIHISPPTSQNPYWGMILLPPQGGAFAQACYERSVRMNYNSPQQPELDFSFNGRGCNASIGRYKILEYVPGASGQPPTALALDFVQHCSPDGGAALFGKIRINSSVPTTEDYLDPTIVVSGNLNYTAAAGAIGGGATPVQRTVPFTALNLIASHNYDNGVSMGFTGNVAGVGTSVSWDADFAAADKAPLVIGSYTNAQRYPFQTAGIAGFDFGFNGAGCNTSYDDFSITSLTNDVFSGDPLDFHANFNQRCNSSTGALTTASIDYTAVFKNAPINPDLIFTNGFSGPVINTVWACP